METMLYQIYLAIDGCLIFFFRITGIPIVDFLIGTFCLAYISVVIGEFSVSLALKLNRPYLDRMRADMLEKERLSLAAYHAGDKASYRALNKAATDVWGRNFFTMVAHSAGILWPIPFCLGWLDSRFADVHFHVAPPFSLVFKNGVGYSFTFIPMYILCRILFKYMRPYLPYFKGVQRMLDAADRSAPAEQTPVRHR
jgi:hypothetical protein